MKRSFIPFVLALVAAHAASAQSIIVPQQDSAAETKPTAVYEAGNLIKADAVVVKGASDLADVNFFEGFASESSEDALLTHVEKAVSKNPERACEIVKQAIVISHADTALVAKIVETACLAAPEQMRIIAQCAIAANPDALAEIQHVLAKLDPATGDGESSKSGKEIVSSKSGKEGLTQPKIEPVAPLTIRVDTPPPIFPHMPPTISPPPATNNDL